VTHVDGISDQLLSRWDEAPAVTPGLPEKLFPVSPHTATVDGVPAAGIRYARFVVPWDATAAPGGEALHYELFSSWLETVRSLGLTPELAIEQAEAPFMSGGETLPRVPGSASQYHAYVGALLAYAASAGESIAYLESWNEPNGTGSGPVGVGHPSARAAAEFTNSATSLCAQYACEAIAGDFADSQYRFAGHPEVKEGATGMGLRYEQEYVAYLSPASPLSWAIHPYAAVKYETPETIASFIGALPRKDASIWFTEVGIYECQRGRLSGAGMGPGEQQGGAGYLHALIDTDFDVAHVFYYEPRSPSREQEANCPAGEDTSLYDYRDEPRPAASILFGPPTRASLALTPFP
jgi:hypothetical protein